MESSSITVVMVIDIDSCTWMLMQIKLNLVGHVGYMKRGLADLRNLSRGFFN